MPWWVVQFQAQAGDKITHPVENGVTMWTVGFSAQYTRTGHCEEGKLDVKYEENLDGKRKEKAQERKEKAQKTKESLFGEFGLLVTTSLLMWGYLNRGCPSFWG